MKTPTPMTKSPRAVAQEALRLAQGALPADSAVRSRKEFTQRQLFAILALKTFLQTDSRGVGAFLADIGCWPPPRSIPRPTTGSPGSCSASARR
jgi:hypothetical protein